MSKKSCLMDRLRDWDAFTFSSVYTEVTKFVYKFNETSEGKSV